MKTRPLILILLLSMLVALCAGEISAANLKPVDFVSLHDPYTRAPDDAITTKFAFANSELYYRGLIPYFRVFIPPGTLGADLLILEGGRQKAVAHHKSPPKGLPEFPPQGYIPDNYYSLSDLEGEDDKWTAETSDGYLYIFQDGFLSPYLPVSRAGWLYVKVGGGEYSATYYNNFLVTVDTKAYNDWWDKYIHDEAGWNQYVESVETYVDPTNTTSPVVQVTPTDIAVSNDAGTTTFSVSNTGAGTMPWTASVEPKDTWLSITSGDSGSDTGTITCAFEANTNASIRTGTIWVTAEGAIGSPKEVTVTQGTAQTEECTATLNGKLLLHIPYITNGNQISGSADFVYEFYPPRFKFKTASIIEDPSFTCSASTMSSDFNKIHIPDLQLLDVTPNYSMDLEFSPTDSSEGNTYYRVIQLDPVPN